jgi:outer membrane protein assembly factor BamB
VLTINFATRALLVLTATMMAAVSTFAQAWSAKLDDKVRFYQVTDVGALIVGTKKSLYAVDGMTGDILWRRQRYFTRRKRRRAGAGHRSGFAQL